MEKSKVIGQVFKMTIAVAVALLFFKVILIKPQQVSTRQGDIQKFVDISEENVDSVVLGEHTTVFKTDNYEILFDKKSLNFVVQTKNQRWYSYAFEEDDQLNEKWYAYSKSSVAIECVNKDLTSYQLSLKRNGKVDRVTIKNDYILATVSFPTAQISFDLVINFENSDLKVKVPYESIKEKGEFKLISIELYPFLGATKGLQNGYYVVPEGSGILVNLSKNTKSTQPYVGRIYGPDIGLSSLSLHQNLNPGERLILPMYSIIKENSFVNVVAEEGDLYTYLKIYRAGITTNYNWITFKFVFREPYKRVINKKGDSVNWYQEKMNKFSPAVFYKFSDTQDLASFNDVAKEFKRYLVNSGKIKKSNVEFDRFPVLLEILMGESFKKVLGKQYVKLTDFDDVSKIYDELLKEGLEPIFLLKGYSKDGLSYSSPNYTPVDKRLGIPTIPEKNLIFYSDLIKKEDFSKVRKVYSALNISEQIIYHRNKVFIDPKYVKMFAQELENLPTKNYSFDLYGQILFTTFSNSRENNLEILERTLQSLSSGMLVLKNPNGYFYKYTDLITGISLKSSDYLLEDLKIPFVQIVLSGLIPYFSDILNNSTDPELSFVELAATGTYPTFALTKEGIIKISDKVDTEYYSSSYSNWREIIIKKSLELSKAFESVSGSEIEKIDIFGDIWVTKFSNGKEIISNFTDRIIEFEGLTLKPKSFIVR